MILSFDGEVHFALDDCNNDRCTSHMLIQLDSCIKGNLSDLRLWTRKMRLAEYLPGLTGVRSSFVWTEFEIKPDYSAEVVSFKSVPRVPGGTQVR